MSNEYEQNPPNPGSLEQSLGRFVPEAPRIDRDRLMFLAGAASAGAPVVARSDTTVEPSHRNRRWLWPASTVTLAATSLALAIALFTRTASPPVVEYRDRLVFRPAPTSSQPDVIAINPAGAEPQQPVLSLNSYIRTREVALRMGVDALGTPDYRSGLATAPTYHELLEVFAPVQKDPPSFFDLFLGM